MQRSMSRTFTCIVSASLCVLAGCDSAPNPNFEHELRVKQGALAGDPYDALRNRWTLVGYLQTPGSYRERQVQDQSAEYASIYESMLRMLDNDSAVRATGELFEMCRPKYEAVLVFWKDTRIDAANVGTAATKVFDGLVACRERVVAAGSSDPNMVLRRFASSGMGFMGLAAVARGDTQGGMKLWQQGDTLKGQDRSDFKLSPLNFR